MEPPSAHSVTSNGSRTCSGVGSVGSFTNLCSGTGSVIATRTPNRSLRYRHEQRSKFDFDAPQYEDFTHPRYAHLKRRLEEAVFAADKRASWMVEELPEGVDGEMMDDLMVDEIDDHWFQIYHQEHEPSSPLTPAGPLITPEASRTDGRSMGSSPTSISRTPLNRHAAQAPSPLSVHSITPGTPQRFGLRGAKPIRILALGNTGGDSERRGGRGSPLSNGGGGDGHGYSSSLGGSPMLYSEMDEIKTPTVNRTASRKGSPAASSSRRWRVSMWGNNDFEARRSSSIEAKRCLGPLESIDVTTAVVDTSFPDSSPSAWSSIPETPPILASGFKLSSQDYNRRGGKSPLEDENEDGMVGMYRKRSLPKDSPAVKHSKGPSQPLLRRIGLARAMRVERPELEEYRPPTSVLVRQQQLHQSHQLERAETSPSSKPLPLSKAKSPVIKRQKVDARFCPAPAPVSKVRNFSSPTPIRASNMFT